MRKQVPHAAGSSRHASARWLVLCWLSASALPAAAEDAPPDRAAYPEAASKKGLQVELVDDALALGVKHAALNVDLARIVAPGGSGGSEDARLHWTAGGREFFFHRGAVERFDHSIRTLSSHDVVIHLIILVYQSPDAEVNRLMLHPDYDQRAPNRLGAFNTQTDEGRAWLAATMEFLAQRWSRPDQKHGRVAGYIVGNEVNSHWWWSNLGRVTGEELVDQYLAAMRLMHRAIRRHAPWARVYVSLDHHWSIRYPAADEREALPGKELLDRLAARARQQDDFDWHVAYHPYPENLFEPRFWNDATALPDADSPRITFKNLEVLTDYLRRPELLYDGKPRRVILSEQGFHTPDGPEGELIQAAAFCYAYRIVEWLEGVDALILHRHVDHPHEGGLRLGLRARAADAADPRPPKLIYECFRAADEPNWEEAFRMALPAVGIQSWAEVENQPRQVELTPAE